jgi:hypothetical protein
MPFATGQRIGRRPRDTRQQKKTAIALGRPSRRDSWKLEMRNSKSETKFRNPKFPKNSKSGKRCQNANAYLARDAGRDRRWLAVKRG